MTSAIELVDGDGGWPRAEAIDREVYPPEVMATVVWRNVTWAHADRRVFALLDGKDVCHVGLYLRRAKCGPREVFIGGIGGVMTLPDARKQGCASAAMRHAERTIRELGCDLGLLFCEPHNIGFYENLGWSLFRGGVICQQPGGSIAFDIMHAMVLPLGIAPQSAVIDLCGLPW